MFYPIASDLAHTPAFGTLSFFLGAVVSSILYAFRYYPVAVLGNSRIKRASRQAISRFCQMDYLQDKRKRDSLVDRSLVALVTNTFRIF